MKTLEFLSFAFILLLIPAFLHAGDSSPSVVKVEGRNGAFKLLRNGKEYFIKGAGGDRHLDTLARCGGNSIRTWGIDRASRDLDNAQKHGLTVTLGFWMAHERHGADYTDKEFLARQKEDVRAMVEKYKDHPALLIWGIGNEVELECKNEEAVWKQVNELAETVRRLDPNHPVMTVVAEIRDEKMRKLESLCPAVDIIGVNSYGGASSLSGRWRGFKAKKPYVVTEFGPLGHWECAKVHGAAVEASAAEKTEMYEKSYRASVLAEEGKYCLGSYAFLWGDKMEGTPTWFGMFLADGCKTPVVETMEKLWRGRLDPKTNRVPELTSIKVSKTENIATDELISAEAAATDPDGDPLRWRWSLIAEVGYSVGGDAQDEAPEFADAIIEGQGTSDATIRLPGGGVYRLYVYVRDGKGNASYASQILQGEGDPPKIPLARPNLPCVVYGDDVAPRWIPSGYMGDHQSIQMETDCTENPHSGETCIKATFSASEGWGGVWWQSPANDWGDKPGGFDLSDATMLEFWVRGEKGGETLKFSTGGLENKAYSDSFPQQSREAILKKEWTRVRIPLDGLDLSRVKTGFGWVFASKGEPVTFYLDDIRYTAD